MKNEGNSIRIINVMKRALKGEPISLGFIGGSITQGCSATDEGFCYAALIYNWWKKNFPASETSYINAGIGATTSQFGAARADDDLLCYRPDVVFIEFSVNDNDEFPNNRQELFRETFEGLVRKILSADNSPAVIIIHSVRFDDGSSEEELHSKIGKYYGIPCISMKECIYSRILKDELNICNITTDNLHPTNYGHALMASHVTDYLESICCKARASYETDSEYFRWVTASLPKPVTQNCYENAVRFNRLNINPELNGFVPDDSKTMEPFVTNGVEVKGSFVRDVFKNGWSAKESGATITFKVTGTEIGILYRKSKNKPAPVAYAILDGDEQNKTELDANFSEDWGDKAYLETIAHHGNPAEHTLTIRVASAQNCISDFYLIAILVSGPVLSDT